MKGRSGRIPHAIVLLFNLSIAHGQSLPNGVASGDVDQTSAVLWARASAAGPVTFAYWREAEDGEEATIERVVVESLDAMIPVKAEIGPLIPVSEYHFRATDSTGAMSEGRFRTPALEGFHGVRFGVSGDWRGELRPYPVVSNVSGRDLDFFVTLGDTIYADYPSPAFPGEQAETPDEFRAKHDEVYSARFDVNSLADLRASTAVFAVIDDHEVTNDFAGGAPPSSDGRFGDTGEFIHDTELFQNGLRAFHEYNPIREETYGDTGEARTAGKVKLYRSRRIGSDAAFFLLDARTFRDEPLEELFALPNRREFKAFLRDSFDSSRTMLGEAQFGDLTRDLLAAHEAGVTWKFILVPEPIQNLGPVLASDRFEGYAHERTRLLQFIEDHEIRNVVFIGADIHGTVVNNITYQKSADGRQIKTDLWEITTGAVAFDAPFGPTTISFTPDSVQRVYNRLGRDGRDRLVRNLGNILLETYGYSPIGLGDSRIDFRVLSGGYVAVNTYGWTEFEIDAATQCLTVTTYGVDWYTQEEMLRDPVAVMRRRPEVLSRFEVSAKSVDRRFLDADIDVLPGCSTFPAPCGAVGILAWGGLVMGFLFTRLVQGGSRMRN